MAKNQYEIDMCNGTIMDKIIRFAIPLMLTNALQLLFNAMDLVVVGRFSGSTQLAAVGSTTSLIAVMTNLFVGISMGVNVLIARYYAAERKRETSEIAHTAIGVAACAGILMLVVGNILARKALILMGSPENVIDLSVLYLRIYFVGMPFFMLFNFGAAILRAVGDTRRPMMYLAFAGVINVCLNMFLVIVFHLGVTGVAVATVISQVISCLLVLRYLYYTESDYQIRMANIRIHMGYLKEVLRIGVPAGLQMVVINFSNALLQSSVNSFGATAMAGFTAANNIFGFMYFCLNSVSQACMSFTSQNLGVKKYDRVDRIFKDCLILQICGPVVMGCAVYFFGDRVIGIYTSDPEAIAYGMEAFAYSALPYFLCGIMDLFPCAMRGMGHATATMLLSVIGTVGVRILWIFGLFPSHRSIAFLFISYPVSWMTTIALQLVCYYFVRKRVFSESDR